MRTGVSGPRSRRSAVLSGTAREIHRLSSTVAGLVPEMIVASLNRLPGADVMLMAPRTAQVLIDVQHPDRHHHTRVDRIGLRVVGEAMIDELALSIMKGNQVMEARQQIEDANEDAEQVAALVDGGWIDADPDVFHPSPPPPQRVRNLGTVGFRGVTARHVSFPSRYEVPALVPGARTWQMYKENRSIHCYVLEHDPDAPWLVNIHGFGQGQPRDFFTFRSASLRDRFGINVVHPVLPLHGPRHAAGYPQMPGVDFAVNVFGLSQAVWDLRRVVQWIRARSDAPVIVHGVSLGGYATALLAGLDDEIDAAIAGIPVVDFPSILRGHAKRMALPADDLNMLASPTIDRFHDLVSPLRTTPKVPAERRFIYAGKLDQISSPDQAMALWNHWGSPAIHWYDGGHVGGAVWDGGVKAFVDNAIASSLVSTRAAA